MYRVSLRELILVTTIVALIVGWCIDRSQRFSVLQRERHFWRWTAIEFQSFLEQDGWKVEVTPRTIELKGKDSTRFTLGDNDREASGLSKDEAWPSADEWSGRPDE